MQAMADQPVGGRVNWKRITPFVISAGFVIGVVNRIWDEAYIHAAICAALALIYLFLGIRGVTEISSQLTESVSDITDSMADGQDGPTL
jgi:hypothetical protein